MRTVGGTFLEMMLYSDSYYSCRIDNITVSYIIEILIGNNGSVDVQSAMNCCKAFRSLSGSYFTKNGICDLQKIVIDGIFSNGIGMIRIKTF